MAGEISEDQATGEIAEIFAELKVLCGVPYVSAIHRYLAAKPGFLEWAWAAVAPAFRDGQAQEAGWRAAAGLTLPPLDPIPAAALRAWGARQWRACDCAGCGRRFHPRGAGQHDLRGAHKAAPRRSCDGRQ